MKKLYILLIVIIAQNITRAQTWTTYTIANGLVNNTVNAIAIDSLNNKWFGTMNGVSMFDGTSWTNYDSISTAGGLVNNNINAIAIDPQGKKWFATGFYYAVGAQGGVSVFDGVNWTNYLTGTTVLSIAIDAQGNKWFGTHYNGVIKFDGTNWTTYTTTDGLAENCVNAIAIDSQGNKWFGTGLGLSKFDDTTWTTYTASNGMHCSLVHAVAIDTNDNVWVGFGIQDGPISIYNGTSWTSTVNTYAQNIVMDHTGKKWIGSAYGRVLMYNGTTWTTYTTANGLAGSGNGNIAVAIDTKGNKWFGTNGGVSRLISPPTITGPANQCEGSTGNTYITETGMSNYAWTLSSGGTITGGGTPTSNTVTITWNAGGTQSVSVNYSNDNCTALNPTVYPVMINSLPLAAGTISGTSSVCQGENNIIYTTPIIAYATSYVWTLPSGATGTSDTNSISVNFGAGAVSGELGVEGNNTCGNGTQSTIYINVNNSPLSSFALYPDSIIPHHYFIISNASGTPPLTYLWNWGDGTYDNIVYPSHTYSTAGTYNICLTITDANGCTSAFCDSSLLQKDLNTIVNVDVVSQITTGINQVDLSDKTKIFPNPANNKIEISLPEKSQIDILNIEGQIVKVFNAIETITTIDISGFAKGMYFVKVKTENGITVKKFVKE